VLEWIVDLDNFSELMEVWIQLEGGCSEMVSLKGLYLDGLRFWFAVRCGLGFTFQKFL
jgi:hypothetical protein